MIDGHDEIAKGRDILGHRCVNQTRVAVAGGEKENWEIKFVVGKEDGGGFVGARDEILKDGGWEGVALR